MRKLSDEEYKNTVLNVLVTIDKICREHDIEYYLAYGTLIGAVRHNGFIPWDDDADIIMLRKEYNKLRDIINKGNYGVRFIDITNDPNTIYPFGKVCDIHTHVKEKNFIQVNNYGAFVDVFPFDNMPVGNRKRALFCRECRTLEKLITHSSRIGYEKTNSKLLNFKRWLAMHISHCFSTGYLVRKLDKKAQSFNNKSMGLVGMPWSWNGLAYPTNYFVGHEEHEFENHLFYIPKEYDKILVSRYGEYMKLPPENERVSLHSIECFIDSN